MAVIDLYWVQDPQGNFDIQIGNNKDFTYVQGFDTLYLYQLFCDRRGTKYDTAAPRERGGWIGDLFTKESGYESGSFIWTKRQARSTPKDLNEVAALAEHALQYFINIGAAQKVKAVVSGNNITGTITIDPNQISEFTALWNAVGKQTS
jgi:phage gp46-like protein